MRITKRVVFLVFSLLHCSGSSFLHPGAVRRPSATPQHSRAATSTTTKRIQYEWTKAPTATTFVCRTMKADYHSDVDIETASKHPRRRPMILSRFAERLRFPFSKRKLLPLLRRRLITLSIALLVLCSAVMGAEAVSAGRSGGVFGPSSSYSSRSSSSSSSSAGSHYSRPMRMNTPPPQIRIYRNPSPVITVFSRPVQTRVYTSSMAAPVATQFTVSDLVLLTGTGALLSYGFLHNVRPGRGGDNDNPRSSPLGPGATVACITVALHVPDRDDPSNVLSLVRAASERADTGTRKGVQDLVSEVALELMRQERSIVSAATQSDHFDSPEKAQRVFQQQSIRHRAKFDRESVNKFGGEDRSVPFLPRTAGDDDDAADAPAKLQATVGVVSIHVAIEGDSTRLPRIRIRPDLLEALSKLASDAQVGDCLLSAEILWAPEERRELLSMDDVYADYPDLIPL